MCRAGLVVDTGDEEESRGGAVLDLVGGVGEVLGAFFFVCQLGRAVCVANGIHAAEFRDGEAFC
jgi:hypothetical protein